MGITYTNYVLIGSEEVPFLGLTQKEREIIANTIRREPLATLGETREKKNM